MRTSIMALIGSMLLIGAALSFIACDGDQSSRTLYTVVDAQGVEHSDLTLSGFGYCSARFEDREDRDIVFFGAFYYYEQTP